MFYTSEITSDSVNESRNEEETISSLEEKRKKLAERSRQLLERQLKSIGSTFKLYY